MKRLVLRAAVSIIIFLVVFVGTTLPVEFALRGSSSTWSAVDKRVVGYLRNFFGCNKGHKDVIVHEEVEPE